MKTARRSRTTFWITEDTCRAKASSLPSLVAIAAAGGGRGGRAERGPACSPPTSRRRRIAAVVAARQQLVGEWTPERRAERRPAGEDAAGTPRGRSAPRAAGGGWGGGSGVAGHGGGGYGGHGGGWLRRGWHGGGGYGAAGTVAAPVGRPATESEPARPMLFTASRITVTNLTPTVTILDPEGGQVRQLHADDKTSREENGNEVKAKWDGSRLVVETKTPRGSVKETWTVSAEPRRLTVRLDVKRSFGGEVTVKRVFDAAPNDVARALTPDPARAQRYRCSWARSVS